MTELTAQQIEGRLISALATIATVWDRMLEPPSRRPGQRTNGTGITLPDTAEEADDTPRHVQVIDARRDVTDTLRGWCQVTVETHDVQHGIPPGTDAPSMARFLTRWSYLLAEHEAAIDLLDEIEAARATVEKWAPPQQPPPVGWQPRRRTMKLGACPLMWQDPDETDDQPCPGVLLGDEEGWVTCTRCGTRAVADWWEAQIAGHGDDTPVEERTVTAEQIVDLARTEFGQRIKPDAVWQWVRRNRLAPIDNNTKPHRYPLRDVVVLLMRKAG